MTLFFVNREPITEYGRVFVERQNNLSEERNTNWHRTLVLGRTDIDGNPNHQLNGGIRGLSKHRCLGSMANHGAGSRKNAEYKTYGYTSLQAILDPVCKSDASVGKSMLLLASRDILKGRADSLQLRTKFRKGNGYSFRQCFSGNIHAHLRKELAEGAFLRHLPLVVVSKKPAWNEVVHALDSALLTS